MQGTIDRGKLTERMRSGDGQRIICGVRVSDLTFVAGKESEGRILCEELRSLMMSAENLNEVILHLKQLEKQLADHSRDPYFDYANRGIFAYATIRYGACFVKGGVRRRIPLKGFLNEVNDSPLHQQVMNFRNKLFSHLDENHDVRSDDLGWEFKVEGSKLVPKGPYLSGAKITLTMGQFNLEWIELTTKLLTHIQERKNSLIAEISELIGPLSITN